MAYYVVCACLTCLPNQLRLWPKDAHTKLPKEDPDTCSAPHPFTGFYLPFPTEDLPHRPMPARPVLGLVSTVPADADAKGKGKGKVGKPKLNWVFADSETRELRYGPRAEAREHVVGPWDWTEDDEQGLTLNGEECLVAVEDEGGCGWSVYWDEDDDRLKGHGIAQKHRVLRCSLERRLVEEDNRRRIDVE